ncbi:MAG: PilZ domain-containing protein, partial [Myxococcota bacterium]|nr:PilZ domain-containing protein [Myxococcota bacterium]
QPEEIEFYNRRSGFRVDAMSDLHLDLLVYSMDEGWIPDTSMSARLDDLSVGGCGVITEGPVPGGVRLRFGLRLGEHEFEVMAECVHSEPPRWPRRGWRHGLCFTELDDPVRNRLYQEIMQQERALLRKRSHQV